MASKVKDAVVWYQKKVRRCILKSFIKLKKKIVCVWFHTIAVLLFLSI